MSLLEKITAMEQFCINDEIEFLLNVYKKNKLEIIEQRILYLKKRLTSIERTLNLNSEIDNG